MPLSEFDLGSVDLTSNRKSNNLLASFSLTKSSNQTLVHRLWRDDGRPCSGGALVHTRWS